MAATITVAEFNGATPTQTNSITNSNYSTVDEVNTDPVANPITPGNNSFEKAQCIRVGDIDVASAIRNLKFFADTGPTDGDDSHVYNGHTVQGTYDATSKTNSDGPGTPADEFVQPVSTASAIAVNAVLTSAPGSANLGIDGNLTGTDMTATGHESDYLYHQIQTDAWNSRPLAA